MYTASRPVIGQYEVKNSAGKNVVSIVMPKGVWDTEKAPLQGLVNATGLASCPQFEWNSQTFPVKREILTNNYLYNFYRIWIEKEGQVAIEATSNGLSKPIVISYKGEEYSLVRKSLFIFDFTLQKNDRTIARFKDTTPFLSFTSKRTFSLHNTQDVDDMLIGFCFWMSAMAFFKC